MPIGNATWGDFTCDTEAEMLSPLNKSVIGTTCLRRDVDPANGGTLYICVALPATESLNWARYADILASIGTGGGTITVETLQATQFGTAQVGFPARSIGVPATGGGGYQVQLGACAVLGALCVAAGDLTIYDANVAAPGSAPASSRRLIQTAGVAGTYYPLVSSEPGAAALFSEGIFAVSTGLWVIDFADGAEIVGLTGVGKLCAVAYADASGLVLPGPSDVVSVKVLVPGTAGNFSVYEDINGTNAAKQRWPSIPFGTLTAGQIVKLGAAGSSQSFINLYLGATAGGVFLVNYLPR
jgi:hypothetical protein